MSRSSISGLSAISEDMGQEGPACLQGNPCSSWRQRKRLSHEGHLLDKYTVDASHYKGAVLYTYEIDAACGSLFIYRQLVKEAQQ